MTPEEEFPPGVKHYGGALLGSAQPAYAYEHVEEKEHHLLWLERFVRDPDGGHPGTVRVLDAHDLGHFAPGYFLQVGGCWKDDGRRPAFDEPTPGEPDVAVVVRYSRSRASFSTDVTGAVRLNWVERYG